MCCKISVLQYNDSDFGRVQQWHTLPTSLHCALPLVVTLLEQQYMPMMIQLTSGIPQENRPMGQQRQQH